MPPNTTDLKLCVEDECCGESLLRLKGVIQVCPETTESPPPAPSFRSTLPQVLATMANSMLLLALGMQVGAPTIVIAALNGPALDPDISGEIHLSNSEASWFAGVMLMMQPTGSVLSGLAQDVLGRKRCMLLVNIPQLAGWALIWYATSKAHLYLAAVLMGFTIGFMEAPTLSYVGEISQPHIRGVLASFTSVYISAGFLAIYLLGSLTDWRTSAAISSLVPILTILAISQMPESPVWLAMKGRLKEAEEALRWLRGWTTSEKVAVEFAAIRGHLDSTSGKIYHQLTTNINGDNKLGGAGKRQTGATKLSDLLRPALFRPLSLVVLYFGFATGAALLGARPYLVRVYRTLGVPIDPFLATVLSSVTQIVGSFVCMAVVRRLGKRRLSLISMSCCSIILLCLGAYAKLKSEGLLEVPWLPLALMALLTFCTNAGIGVIPWALLSEVFPTRGRGLGGGVSAASFYFWLFLFSKTWLDVEEAIGLQGVFFLYAGVGVLGLLFLFVSLPETEGKTLKEVEGIFEKKWLRR